MKELTIAEASARSGISVSHLRSLCRDGAVKARRWGKSWMVSQASLDAFAANRPKRGPKPRKGITPVKTSHLPITPSRSGRLKHYVVLVQWRSDKSTREELNIEATYEAQAKQRAKEILRARHDPRWHIVRIVESKEEGVTVYYADIGLDRPIDRPYFIWRQVTSPFWGQEAWDPETRRWIDTPWLCCFPLMGEIGSEEITEAKALEIIARWEKERS